MMDTLGLNTGFVLAQIASLALLAVWIFLAFKALRHLSESLLSLWTRLVWIVLIVGLPLLGAAAYLLTMGELQAAKE